MKEDAVCLTPLRNCFEGAVPSVLATCSPDGVPNVTYLSQVQYVDERHVALTFQFFNKTRRNILANPWAVLKVVDPFSGHGWRLHVRYLCTETNGALFESMKAKLAGIASHTGMAEVFRLLGADVYEVLQMEAVPSPAPAPVPAPADHLPRLRRACALLDASRDLGELLDNTLAALQTECGIEHQMILKLDERGERLFTVASRGYAISGVGSEIPMGHGVIGVAARERTPIRISHMTSEYAYGKAVRESAAAQGLHHHLETAIPMPGLAECRSQMAVPILAGQALYGVLYVESPLDLRFSYDDEDLLQVVAQQFGWMARSFAAEAVCEPGAEAAAVPSAVSAPAAEAVLAPERPAAAEAAAATGTGMVAGTPAAARPLQVRYFRADHSVFLDEDYLIKGLAGAILWRLMQALQREGRDQFSNRELRLDPQLALPEVADNLEARLVLLQRRLAERSNCVRMRKTGRGRFALEVLRPLRLVAVE
jgi:adenylate cyclase